MSKPGFGFNFRHFKLSSECVKKVHTSNGEPGDAWSRAAASRTTPTNLLTARRTSHWRGPRWHLQQDLARTRKHTHARGQPHIWLSVIGVNFLVRIVLMSCIPICFENIVYNLFTTDSDNYKSSVSKLNFVHCKKIYQHLHNSVYICNDSFYS